MFLFDKLRRRQKREEANKLAFKFTSPKEANVKPYSEVAIPLIKDEHTRLTFLKCRTYQYELLYQMMNRKTDAKKLDLRAKQCLQ